MATKESGVVVLLTGMVIMIVGLFLLFDRALVIAGHILMLVGFVMLFRSKTFSMLQQDKIQGTSFFVLGIVVFFLKYQLLGTLMEIIGLLMIVKASLPSFRSLLLKLLFRTNVK